MTFTLFPALDVADGALARGSAAALSPFDLVRSWQRDGARWIHLVDLDAAVGRRSNAELVNAIAAGTDVHVQRSGGIADDESLAAAFASGADRVSLATSALRDLSWCERVVAEHGERVVMSLDVRSVATSGASPELRLVDRGSRTDVGKLEPVIADLARMGCRRVIVADAVRDGSLSGPDIDLYRTVAALSSMGIITAGGIAGLDDLGELQSLAGDTTVEGAIVGSALLNGRFSVRQALAVVGDDGGHLEDG